MNIKSLLLGSAAALAAVSGAQAADAIVAAEPEPMEYVRVCDAFGTGYFYIPGTETCLKIGGYVRFQVDGRSDSVFGGDGYRTNTRGQVRLESKSDTEFGTLTGRVTLRANTNSPDYAGDEFFLEETYIEIGGFRAGHFYNYFDTGLAGETVLTDGGPTGSGMGTLAGDTLNNAIRYTYEGAAFTAYAGVDFFNSEAGWKTDEADTADEIGVNGLIAGKFGAVAIDLFAGYDFDSEEAAFASTLTAEIGPGKLGVFGAYATGINGYYDFSEWTIGAEYEFAVSDKFKISPGAQYWDNISLDGSGDFDGGDAWRAGVTLDYAITTNLSAKATVNYNDVDYGNAVEGSDEYVDGFLRLQRSF